MNNINFDQVIRVTYKQKECDITVDVFSITPEDGITRLFVSPYSGVYVKVHGIDFALDYSVADLYAPQKIEFEPLFVFMGLYFDFLLEQVKGIIETSRRKYNRPFIPYSDYVQSKEWEDLKNERIKLDDYRCRFCGHIGCDVQAHHITYGNVGCHEIDDLITLCQPCHNKIHSKNGANDNE